jgi:hypothetical protein
MTFAEMLLIVRLRRRSGSSQTSLLRQQDAIGASVLLADKNDEVEVYGEPDC